MTAFLDVEVLRAHAVRPNLRDALVCIGAPRPTLTARWVIAPDGRLTCHWQAQEPAPDRPPH